MFGFSKHLAALAAATALLVSVLGQASATTPTVLTFEGLKDQETIASFYNGGLGGLGSGPGPSYGITFSPKSLALIEQAAGGTGNFAGEPSPKTAAFFLSDGPDRLNDPAGFDTAFSFFYSAINTPGEVKLYSGQDATGNLLADVALPVTPKSGTVNYSPFVPFGFTFSGVAKSVDFGGSADHVVFDNLTFGSDHPATPGVVPEPASMALLGFGVVPMIGRLRRRASA